ncbi:MAG TPA: oxygen-independent coproporphyrinogen III oxidase [Clostridiaceae bacterium]|nr:oxygen-independent coproporphyrinogen III oxidase [Clostridiaceae bacterium]
MNKIRSNESKTLGLYIHIPFCKSKCLYCDFNSFAGMEMLIEPYFNALKKEIELYAGRLEDCLVKTIFIGGGTPSFVDAAFISDLLHICERNFTLKKDTEISMEANPGTLSREKLETYMKAGINRLSIGLQAWQNKMLKFIGRIHTVEEFLDNFRQARDEGFKNINIDLIFGLPGQTMADWKETVDSVAGLNPEHVSCYSLKIEKDTPFWEMLETGKISQAEDEMDREMYYYAKEKFNGKGMKHYEISNFAYPGFECEHNLIYWKAEEYIGIGAGSHSYINGERYNNVYDICRYIKEVTNGIIPLENVERIDFRDRVSEFIILGLRLIEGISTVEFRKKFGCDISDIYGRQLLKLTERGLIEQKGNNIMLTGKGLDLANQVFIEFV